jgi:hypothetical protein
MSLLKGTTKWSYKSGCLSKGEKKSGLIRVDVSLKGENRAVIRVDVSLKGD